jgi:hypothetical protein
MCIVSITTNQAAIIALFRVINRYVGNLPPDACWRIPRLPGSRHPQHGHRDGDGDDALGYATTVAHGRAASHEHPQHILAALAQLAQAGDPMLGASQ